MPQSRLSRSPLYTLSPLNPAPGHLICLMSTDPVSSKTSTRPQVPVWAETWSENCSFEFKHLDACHSLAAAPSELGAWLDSTPECGARPLPPPPPPPPTTPAAQQPHPPGAVSLRPVHARRRQGQIALGMSSTRRLPPVRSRAPAVHMHAVHMHAVHMLRVWGACAQA